MTALWLFFACGGPATSPLADPALDAHNTVRSPLGLEPLSWDEALTEEAERWTAHLASDEDCALIHDGTTGLGENLYWSSEAVSIGTAVDAWASEVAYYDLEGNACDDGEQCGHYTQIVWSSTERIGCAVRPCPSGGEVTMCTYDPPGNFIGERPY